MKKPTTSRTSFSRRQFLATSSLLAVAARTPLSAQQSAAAANSNTLALDGGTPAVVGRPGPLVRFGEAERRQLDEAIRQPSLFYWRGPQTKLLISRFQEHYPLKYVHTCSSGTAALHIAVAAANLGPGDEVITTPITDLGTVIGILFQQAVPVFADLGRDNYNLDPADVERKITSRTKAIIAVHLMGNPCDMAALRAIADRRGLVLIEDCAQAWGTLYRGKPVGTLGHIACFSLQDSKHITCGDGGIVASSDERFGPKLQMFGDKGFNRVERDEHGPSILATNYRMSETQAAVAAAQMTKMEQLTAERARFGDVINEEIRGAPGVIPHGVAAGDRCTYWFYMWRIDPAKLKCDTEQFHRALRAEGVPASAGYIPVPMYRYPVFSNHAFFAGRWPLKESGLTKMDYTNVSCPEAEAILRTCYRFRPERNMDEAYVRSIGRAIRKVATHYAVT